MRRNVATKKMSMTPIYRAIAPLLLVVVLCLSACDTAAPPPVSSNGGSSNPPSQTTPETQPTTPTPTATETQTTIPAPTTTAPTTTAPVTSEPKTAAPMADIAGLKPQKGSAFNKFFPNCKGANYQCTFTQEKEGFAEIKLSLKGAEVAKISISDTVTNLTARSKFQGAKDKVSGYPLIAQGKNASAVLVGDRYQVKIMSRSNTFTEAERKTWLGKVDLKGLAALK